ARHGDGLLPLALKECWGSGPRAMPPTRFTRQVPKQSKNDAATIERILGHKSETQNGVGQIAKLLIEDLFEKVPLLGVIYHLRWSATKIFDTDPLSGDRIPATLAPVGTAKQSSRRPQARAPLTTSPAVSRRHWILRKLGRQPRTIDARKARLLGT